MIEIDSLIIKDEAKHDFREFLLQNNLPERYCDLGENDQEIVYNFYLMRKDVKEGQAKSDDVQGKLEELLQKVFGNKEGIIEGSETVYDRVGDLFKIISAGGIRNLISAPKVRR